MAEADKDDLITLIEEDAKVADIPDTLPLMPVRDVVIFTDMLLPLFIGRDKSVRAVEEAVSKDGLVFLATQKDPGIEDPRSDDIFNVGTVSRVLRMLKLPDGRVKALVQGISKAKIKKYLKTRYLYRVQIEKIEESGVRADAMELEALMRNVRENSEKILSIRGEMSGEINAILEGVSDAGKLADLVASNLKLKIEESQQILEIVDPVALDLGVKGCTAALYNMCIEPNGDVIPCQSYYQALGNVRRNSWDSIWNHELAVYLRERRYVAESCKQCALLMECGGGCPLHQSRPSTVGQAQPEAGCLP